jgi:hypothetical protein
MGRYLIAEVAKKEKQMMSMLMLMMATNPEHDQVLETACGDPNVACDYDRYGYRRA